MTWATVSVLENELGVFILYGIFLILFCLWFGHVLRQWSWTPRNRHTRRYTERF